MSSKELENIIEHCKKNDRKAQNELFHHFKDALYLISLKYCRNREDAEDNLHDAFITIFNKIGTYKGKGSFAGWAKRITIYKAIDRYKNQKEFPYEIPSVPNENEPGEIETTLTDIPLEVLLRFVQELPDQYRLVFNLFQLDGYSHKEISKMLSISENTSKSNYHRAKLLLKKKITNHHRASSLNKTDYGS